MIRTKAQRAEDRKKRDLEWEKHLKKKQKHPTKLRTGKPIPYSKRFSEVVISYREGSEPNGDNN